MRKTPAILLLLAVALFVAACNINVATPEATPTAAAVESATITTTNEITDAISFTATATVTPPEPISVTVLITPTAVAPITPTVAAVTQTTSATPTINVTPTGVVTVAPGAGIFDAIAGIDTLDTFNSALVATGLIAELDVPTRTLTIFAPTNQAFAALPATLMESLMADPATLANVLRYHVVVDQVTTADLVGFGAALTALGETVPVTQTASGAVTVGNATVVQGDIAAADGLIHIIDTVLLPPSLITGTGTITNTGNGSLAPATGITTTGSVTEVQVVTSDVTGLTIAQVISTTPGLGTLSVALQAAGMTNSLQGPGPLTVFAPTDEAFASLPAGALDTLLNSPTQLVNVLQYHVIADQALAGDLTRLGAALSISGQPITITVGTDGVVTANNARIIQSDIPAANGTIHIIDVVLTPPAQ